ncbi:glycosyltransferase family 31 protein [Xylariaceae sp. FL0662B]|nr:glycosyltransferase family 31 protein [Xylariaceae sp. FL0662B]
MFHSKVPRVFIFASAVLFFLATYTTFHLYNRGPSLDTTGGSHVASIQDAAPTQEPRPTDIVKLPDGLAQVPNNDESTPPLPPPPPPPSPGQLPKEPPAPAPGLPNNIEGDPVKGEHPLPVPNSKDCPKDLELLVRASVQLELTERVHYSRRYIQPVYSNTIDGDHIANHTEPLIEDPVEINLWDCQNAKVPESAPLKLEVPKPYSPESFAHMTFGIATDYNRLDASIETFAQWLSDSGANLVGVVTDASHRPPQDIDQLHQKFKAAGMDVTLVGPLDEKYTTSQNHFAVLIPMLERSHSGTEWYGLLDDDTFFPHLKPLSDSLARLNHNKDMYVGTLSEDFEQVRKYGMMAFGGAGAFLSAALAQRLSGVVRQCVDEGHDKEGDIIIRDCIFSNSKARLTILPGLYQQDIRGDVSGFFEAGLRPLNLHHWKSWYDEPVDKMATAATFCGDCFLQRWRFSTDTVLTNGFSIVRYTDGLESVDLDFVEGTWMRAEESYSFAIGPMRQQYPVDKKQSYRLRESQLMKNGDLKQLYLRAGNSAIGEVDEVVELVWQKH